jgi:hypothetical protein
MSASLQPISRDAAGRPRTFRVQRPVSREAAYRRFAITVLGLDVQSLTAKLRAARLGEQDQAEDRAPLQSAA